MALFLCVADISRSGGQTLAFGIVQSIQPLPSYLQRVLSLTGTSQRERASHEEICFDAWMNHMRTDSFNFIQLGMSEARM